MKVYIVTQGKYSDYHIEAVFATRKTAERAIAQKLVYGNIEEWGFFRTAYDLKKAAQRCSKYSRWTVSFTGDSCMAAKNTHMDEPRIAEDLSRYFITRNDKVSSIHVSLYARSKKHAIKSAAEKRAAFLASEPLDALLAGLPAFSPGCSSATSNLST